MLCGAAGEEAVSFMTMQVLAVLRSTGILVMCVFLCVSVFLCAFVSVSLCACGYEQRLETLFVAPLVNTR